MDLNTISLLLVLTLTISQQKKKKQQSRITIGSCQTFIKRQNSFEKKKVQFNRKVFFFQCTSCGGGNRTHLSPLLV
jgi:hypothetical protein